MRRPGAPAHYFTVDVEEYFQVSAFESHVSRADWDGLERRVDIGVRILLDLLARHRAKGTFFILGWIAERYPDLVRSIHAEGHEIASHGWGHRRVTTIDAGAFRRSVRSSKALLESIVNVPVVGYRAPSFSITPGHEWALDILLEEGYEYDSSLFPVRRRGYGYPGVPPFPFPLTRPRGPLMEFPPATVGVFGQRLPAGGGAYLRLFPRQWIAAGLAEAERRGESATLYLHPWEVDPAQPRLASPWRTRIRHYTGISRTMTKLEYLFDRYRFTSFADHLVPRTVPPHA